MSVVLLPVVLPPYRTNLIMFGISENSDLGKCFCYRVVSSFPQVLRLATVKPNPAPLSQERLARLLQQNTSDT